MLSFQDSLLTIFLSRFVSEHGHRQQQVIVNIFRAVVENALEPINDPLGIPVSSVNVFLTNFSLTTVI